MTMVLSDRYYDDLLVDPVRYRYGAPLWLARFVFKFMPRPDRVIVLTGDPEIIHARKKEVTMDELCRQIDAYQELERSMGGIAVGVDAGQDMASVIRDAENAILDTFERRSRS